MTNLIQLNKAFEKLAKAPYLDDLLRKAVLTLREELDFDRAGIILYEPDTKTLRGSWGTGPNGRLRAEHHMSWPISDQFIISHKDNGLRILKDHKVYDNDVLVKVGWHVQAPIFSGKDLFGWVFVDNLYGQKPLEQDQIEILKPFTTVLAQLIERTKIEDTLLHALDSLASNEDATSMALEKVHQLESQVAGNKKMVILAERLSGLVPMSARAVGNLTNFMALLSPDQFNDADTALLDSACKSADQLSRIFKHFDQKVRDATDNDVQTMPASVINEYWQQQFSGLFRKTPHSLVIRSEDPEESLSLPLILLTQLVKELINNALIHGLENSERGNVRVSIKRHDKIIAISVEDSGAGLDEEQYLDVLKLFVTSKPYEYLGSGLNVTQHYMERWLNGQLDLGPSEMGGLCCTLNIPIQNHQA